LPVPLTALVKIVADLNPSLSKSGNLLAERPMGVPPWSRSSRAPVTVTRETHGPDPSALASLSRTPIQVFPLTGLAALASELGGIWGGVLANLYFKLFSHHGTLSCRKTLWIQFGRSYEEVYPWSVLLLVRRLRNPTSRTCREFVFKLHHSLPLSTKCSSVLRIRVAPRGTAKA
jgi:hypothetical protein